MDFNAILAQLRNGQAREARATLDAACAAGSDSAPVQGLLARACLALGDREGARRALDAGFAHDRNFAPLWLERAMLARLEGRGDELVAALREAQRLMPAQPGVALDLAGALLAMGSIGEADAVVARLCGATPQLPAAWKLRGEIALRVGNAEAAERSYAQAQRLAPNDVDVLRGLADATALGGKPQGEIWARQRIASLAPDDALAQAELGDALRRDDRPEDARVAFARALERRPGDLQLQWLALNTLPIVVPDAASEATLRHRWDEAVAALDGQLALRPPDAELALAVLSSATNFYRHYLGEPLVDAQRTYGRVLERFARAAFPGDALPPRRAGGRRRIAIVSSHFHAHTIWKLFRCWFEKLDPARFELVAVHLDAREDAATAEVRRLAAGFIGAQPSLRETVARLRELAPDAIVYLDVAMHPHGQALAALRLAPLQCATWGHPITTGQPTIDVFLSSAAMEPADGERHYSERLVRLPGLGLSCTLDGRPAAASPLHGRRYLFCAQSAQKLVPAHDACFADILEACPGHALVLVPHDKPHVRERLAARVRAELGRRGVDPARLVVLPALAHDAFLAVARDADVVVDSLGWSGGMTTMESLAVGAPVVTLPGDTMRSRHSAALVATIGRPEWVASERTDFVLRVASVAGSGIDRAAIARDAREAFAQSPWLDDLSDALDCSN